MKLLTHGSRVNFLTLSSSGSRRSWHSIQSQGEQIDPAQVEREWELPKGVPDSEEDSWTLELFLRGSPPTSQTHQQKILEKLAYLSDHGLIDDVQTRIWPDRIGIEPKTACTEFIGIYEDFEKWARDHEISIHPPFTIREYSSSITQGRGKVLITPVMFLTIYRNSELVGMYPCETGGTTITIGTWVSGFSSDESMTGTKDRSLQAVRNSG